MLQEDFCEKLLRPLVVFQLYLLRTRRREQHRNGNKNMYLPLSRKHCHFYKRRKIWWLFLLMNCFLSWTLQLQMKRADTKPMLAGAFIHSCKTKKWKQRTCCPGYPWSWKQEEKEPGDSKSWPADLWAWAVAHTRLYRKASISWICSSWSLSALGYTGVIAQLD